jgi:hypothetical protein
VLGPIDALFAYISGPIEFAVTQFANWNTGGKIAKRIMGVAPHFTPEMVELALKFGRAINNGVVVFRKQTVFSRVWYAHALLARDNYIPDEATLQVLVANSREITEVIPHWWNTSCKYDEPLSSEAKIVHYHGRKHCRLEDGKPVHYAELWYTELESWKKISVLAGSLEHTDRHVRDHAAAYAAWKKGRA